MYRVIMKGFKLKVKFTKKNYLFHEKKNFFYVWLERVGFLFKEIENILD